MKHRSVTRPSVKPLVLALAAALGASSAAIAGPVGPTIVNGTIQVTQPDAHTTLIKQDSSKAIIDWRSFSIGAGEHVQFQQPDGSSVALNRVTTAATPSEIYGSLSANGKVFLVNPAGVVFGKSASVDVGALVASTLDIRDDDFLAGRYAFLDGGGAGTVRNEGRLTAFDGGTVALLGAQVSNEGTISARLGTVGLAAGGKVLLDFGGDGLTRIVVDAAGINALVENGGAVLSEGGQVMLTARALGALAGTVVRNTGVVSASSLVERNGRIVLDGGEAGTVEVGGTLDVSGSHGGAVTVLGHDIGLTGAAIDARGETGGGTVLVGGAYRGADPALPHAATTTMDAGSSIRADALGSGDGGTIALWSDGLTSAKGALSARGGASAGDGGIIETSGARVDVGGLTANASAAKGKAGSWLLDPADVTIDTAMAKTISDVLNTGTAATTDSSGSIYVNADITKTAGADTSLVLHAGQDIALGSGVKIGSTSGKLNLDFRADLGSIDIGYGAAIQARGGNVALAAGASIGMEDGAAIQTGGGDLTLSARSAIDLGSNLYYAAAIQTGGSNATAFSGTGSGAAIQTGGGNATLSGGSGITLRDGSLIQTGGGNATLYGGNDPATASTNGNVRQADGIAMGVATLDTRDPAHIHDGDIVMVGKGDDGNGGTGIALDGTTLQSASGNIGLVGYGGSGGTGSAGVGVHLALGDDAYGGKISATTGSISISGTDGAYPGPSGNSASGPSAYGAPGLEAALSNNGSIATTGGNILLRGDSYKFGIEGGAAAALSMNGGTISSGGRLEITGIAHQDAGEGLYISGASSGAPVLSAGAGGMLLAGHGGSDVGVDLEGIAATTSGGGQLSVAGESATYEGVGLYEVVLGDPAMTGNIVLRAYGASSQSPMLAVWDETPLTTLRTSGVVAILPGGVDLDGKLTTHGEVPITVGNRNATGFGIALQDLGLGGSGSSRVVIGSQEQKAAITWVDATPFNGDLTLQNDAAGSAGIVVGSNINVSGQLTLSSGGTVTAADLGDGGGGAPAISAAGLLLHGSMPESNFQLTAPGNQVGQFAAVFDVAKSLQSPDFGDVNFSNTGALTVASLAAKGFSSASNAAVNLGAPSTVVAGDLLLQTTGNLTLGQNISTLGSDITLVTGGIFLNPGNSLLTPGADGSWRVFADTWAGEVRGKLAPSFPHPNLYGCSYGSSCSARITGNHFFYRAQPVLTITPDSLARAYGDPNPVLSYSANLINGDTLADAVSGSYSTTAVQSSPVGSYATTAGVFTSPVGYQIVTRPGTLTVNPAQLLVNIDSQAKVYGDADPLLTATISGMKLGDSADIVTGLTLSTVTGQAATAGTHPITGANAVTANPNYSIAYQPGVLTVGKAPLLVNIADQAKTYGDADPLLSATYSGFRYGDTDAVVSGLALSTATGAAATAGIHPITGANASAANYSFVYQAGTLKVAQAPLTVLVDDKRKQYGDADPVLTYQLGGLKYQDTAADVGDVKLSTATGAAATAGTHPIVATTGSASNYVVSSQPGTLTVDKAPLLVTANDKAKVYGDPEPVYSASATGLKYADTAAVVTGLVFGAPAGAAATAGTHPITVSNGAADNYTLSYQGGILTVGKAVLTVTADNKSKVYGAADPALTATISGFKYGDTGAVVGGLALSAPTGAAATAGTHPITAANAGAANYDFTYVPGVLSVDPGVLSYVANPAFQFQGAPAQPLAGSVTGFAYGDTLASATTGTLAFTSTATQHSDPGLYAVQGGGLSSANYRFVQAEPNGSALKLFVSPAVFRPSIIKDVTFDSSEVYDKNFGTPHVCVAAGPLETGLVGADGNDTLAIEWSRVRVSPNLSNCLGLGERNGCSDF